MLQVLMLERVEAALNVRRYYVLSIEPTLFGIALRRAWGRIGSPRGRVRFDFHEGSAEAAEALEAWLSRKLRRGYAFRAADGDVGDPPGASPADASVAGILPGTATEHVDISPER